MKEKFVLTVVLLFCIATTFAQDEAVEEKLPFFKKENLFTGGTLNLGFGNNSTSLGASPYFG